jgi:hypothetical protein
MVFRWDDDGDAMRRLGRPAPGRTKRSGGGQGRCGDFGGSGTMRDW